MDYKFTAIMEDKLDDISNGKLIWNEVLKEFYSEFHPLVMNVWSKNAEIEEKYTKLLGVDPKTGYQVYSTIARYGPVVKLISKNEPKFAKIIEPLTINTITLNEALKLLEYPKELGIYEKKKIFLNKNLNGFYIKMDEISFHIENENITFQAIIELIKNEQQKYKPLAEFFKESKIYQVLNRPYGKYIKITDKKTKKIFSIKLPEFENIKELTLEKINNIISTNGNKKINNNYKNNNKENKKKAIKKAKKKAKIYLIK